MAGTRMLQGVCFSSCLDVLSEVHEVLVDILPFYLIATPTLLFFFSLSLYLLTCIFDFRSGIGSRFFLFLFSFFFGDLKGNITSH